MVISQLINPADLVTLDERQFSVLQASLLSEMLANPEVRGQLEARAQDTLKGIKGAQRRTKPR